MQRIFSRGTLRSFWETRPETEQYLKTWYETVMRSEWKTPHDIRQTYATASILKHGYVVFNIMGNAYRLVARINFEGQWLFIQFISDHKDYDRFMNSKKG